MASENTAAATVAVGVTRRDPMAMIPFCGYNMADYFQHWLEMGPKIKHAPKIFHVNWFRKDANGKFLWPGYGDNVRVLKWMLDRIERRAAATETPIGYVPAPGSLTLDGLAISRDVVHELLRVDPRDWSEEADATAKFFEIFGNRLPAEIRSENKALQDRLHRTTVTAR
jgi:phosphoenolpyruvate carboxykinase (GTP)